MENPPKTKAPATSSSGAQLDQGSVIELPDTGPPVPMWQNENSLGRLLTTNAPRERELASDFLHLADQLGKALDRTKSKDRASEAKQEFVRASRLVTSFLRAATTLRGFRSGGTQRIVRVEIDRNSIGAAAKLEALRHPNPSEADASFIFWIDELLDEIRRVTCHFERNALGTRNCIDDIASRDRAIINGLPIASEKEAMLWDALVCSALSLTTKISAALEKFERDGCQLVVTERSPETREPERARAKTGSAKKRLRP